ncbi:MAG: RHS repeat-associated core domain-containing protein, partial [Bacteroidales bacterium]|nr:RHS repeat-associated core domain-containing protein [Bacteroidales bacterium]
LCFSFIKELQEYDEDEKFIFFYHKDHLGSSTQISDRDANIIHHIEYMPSGEQFSEQRDNWATPYKFNSKELDAETGLYYYGARYYTPEIGIWLSVDPMSDERPSLSPYNYCQLNPVMRVDPSGMLDDLYINGEDAQAAFNQLKSSTNLELSRDEKTGKIESKGVPKTDNDIKLFDAINNSDVENHIKADKNNDQVADGGGFFGNKLVNKGDKVIARTFQVVVPEKLEMLDGLFDKVGSGKSMLHEATEAHQGGLISLATGKPAKPKYIGTDNSIYDMAHMRATLQPGHGKLLKGQINAAMSAKIMHQTWTKFNKY